MDGFAIDSRDVSKGDLFFAIKGQRVDGHQFLRAVAEKGAKGAVVSQDYSGPSFGLEIEPVPDVTYALQERARLHLLLHPKRVVAISGSLGKTTTKGFAKTLLETRYSVWASPKSYNSQLTVPLSILRCPDVEILLLEMGMSEPGNLARLIEIAPPEVALLTCISLQHADHFPDGLEGIRREKLTLFSHPKTRLCLHHESIDWPGQPFSVENPYDLPWPYPFLHNLSAAMSIARAFGVSNFDAAIPKLVCPKMRLEEIEKSGIHFINDAYNANPESMIAALNFLSEKGGRRIAVLSEMDALGQSSASEHEQVAKEALDKADLLLCLGQRCDRMLPVWQKAEKPVFFFHEKGGLRQKLKELLEPGDQVLLKGARVHSLEELLDDY